MSRLQGSLRIGAAVIGAGAVIGGAVLGRISVMALRRREGVFMPAGYVAIACLVAGVFLLRYAVASD